MLSFLSGLPSDMATFVGNHLEFCLGYAAGILFPVPWLSTWIHAAWGKLLTLSSTSTTTPPAPPPAPPAA